MWSFLEGKKKIKIKGGILVFSEGKFLLWVSAGADAQGSGGPCGSEGRKGHAWDQDSSRTVCSTHLESIPVR